VKTPIRQTALWQKHRQSGAEMVDFCGWSLPSSFSASEFEQVRGRVGICDWSCLAKFDLKGSGLAATSISRNESRYWHLGRAHYLVTCEPGNRETVEAEIRDLEGAARDLSTTLYWTDVTSVMADLVVTGPRSRDVLGKITSAGLSDSALPNGGCVQASLAHVRSIILRSDMGGLPAFHILGGREFGESVWDAIIHAGHEFHIEPFGLKTYQALETGAGL
jgi:4-methylaminobutanoate oxidase (formaldehyde-forming)